MSDIIIIGLIMIVGGFAAVLAALAVDNALHLFEAGMVAAVAGVIALFMAMGVEDAHKRFAFMKACTADHKPYECEAVWRAGEARATPPYVPIIIPSIGR